jgi:hypothetical protein
MERRFGHDFSRVRVHHDAQAAASARVVGAQAYTVGHDVVFGTSQYAPAAVSGRHLLAHELTHVVQQAKSPGVQPKLKIGVADDQYEREADRVAMRIHDDQSMMLHAPYSPQASNLKPGLIQRRAIYTGKILDEGSCEHLACNSKWACEDNENGLKCPEGTRNASEEKKYRPLFTCDTKCENNKTCSDTDNWMAIPKARFARSKCDQDLVICANGAFTHAHVRDRSHVEAWEVGHGVQDDLNVSPYETFRGSIYGDENDAAFKKDSKCRKAATPEKSEGESSPTESTPTSTTGPFNLIEAEGAAIPEVQTSTTGREEIE